MKQNDTDDNDYDHHHHRDDNGGNNVTTRTVPVRGISPTSSSYNSTDLQQLQLNRPPAATTQLSVVVCAVVTTVEALAVKATAVSLHSSSLTRKALVISTAATIQV